MRKPGIFGTGIEPAAERGGRFVVGARFADYLAIVGVEQKLRE